MRLSGLHSHGPVRPGKQGFTLVEVLVVIAIMMILAALLFPAIGAARETAKLRACASNLRTLMEASLLYANETGLYPGRATFSGGLDGYLTDMDEDIDENSVWLCPSDPRSLETLRGEGSTPYARSSYGQCSTWLMIPKYASRGFGINDFPLNRIREPANSPSIGDSYREWIANNGFQENAEENMVWRHKTKFGIYTADDTGYPPDPSEEVEANGTANVAYYDGHVQSWTIQEWLEKYPHSEDPAY